MMNNRRVPIWLTAWEYAHRGLHSEGVPENSLAAATAAIAAGLGIECDIQRSGDGAAMVFHDWDTERLTGVSGETGEISADDLRRLTYTGSGESPVTLTELLDLVAARVPLLIEIKSKPDYHVGPSCAAVSAALQTYAGDHAVMSFDPEVARWFRAHSPETCIGLVMREDEYGYTQTAEQRLAAFQIAEPDFLAYHIAALPNTWVAELREGGVPVLSWTVNSPETRARAQANVDALISEGRGLE